MRGDRGRRQGGRARAQERGANRARRVPEPRGGVRGGTLARDIAFLLGTGSRLGLATPLFGGVKASNDVHRQWARRRLGELLGDVSGKTVAVLGLTYKANTDTLRRSESVGLCHWLAERGARVRAHDPAIREHAPELPPSLTLSATIDDAIRAADAVVIATEWPAFRELSADRLVAATARPLVLDAGRFLAANLAGDPRVRYFAVGIPSAKE